MFSARKKWWSRLGATSARTGPSESIARRTASLSGPGRVDEHAARREPDQAAAGAELDPARQAQRVVDRDEAGVELADPRFAHAAIVQ